MHSKKIVRLLLILLAGCSFHISFSQHSVARQWNEVLLEAIRNDFARPTVHARNLFHVSAASYDTWSLFDGQASPYLIGNNVHGFNSFFEGYTPPGSEIQPLLNKAISYACYRLILHRFADSPGWSETRENANNLMETLGYDIAFTSTDYSKGSAAALGNFIAQTYISYGLLDQSNEQEDYENNYYQPVNGFLDPTSSGNPNLDDPNRWQPLAFDVFIDQSGNEIPGAAPEFLSPEWGQVFPFSLKEEDKTIHSRDGFAYQIYHDPGPPPYLELDGSGFSEEYIWSFSMVAIWSGHLDSSIDTQIDISPASIGNIDIADFPSSIEDHDSFYQFLSGGDIGKGHEINPYTNQPYSPQIVSLGDYGRVLAEFWADGPDSETPPGHWFTLLNYVSDHPDFEKKWMGSEAIGDLEWDVKSYFILGGAMHDAAIAAWGIKGYYDYIRPISAIRYMAEKGQSSDPNQPRYSPQGILLIDDQIELVMENDPLVGTNNENLHKVKLKAWMGPDRIIDPASDEAGVDWILAENWWPYQRPTFVTPPFAGYVSGHSTFSRAAAEVLTSITGDAFFPGGMGEFVSRKNEFLVFEEGPSEDIILQWATYRDASDQCSLSRIWGGIHPPADDLPGRIVGEKIGLGAVAMANTYFEKPLSLDEKSELTIKAFPNPTNGEVTISADCPIVDLAIFDLAGNENLNFTKINSNSFDLSKLKKGVYLLKIDCNQKLKSLLIVVQ